MAMGKRGDNFSSSHQALFVVLFLRRIYVSMGTSFRLSVRGYIAAQQATSNHAQLTVIGPILSLFMGQKIFWYFLQIRSCHRVCVVDYLAIQIAKI